MKTDAPVVKAYQDSRSFGEFLRHENCFGDAGTMPQVEWLWKGEDRDRIPLDYVGRVESIDEDFEHISDRIGVEASLPRQNVSSAVSHERFYESDEDVEIVVEKYAQDFDRLGYEKTLAEQ